MNLSRSSNTWYSPWMITHPPGEIHCSRYRGHDQQSGSIYKKPPASLPRGGHARRSKDTLISSSLVLYTMCVRRLTVYANNWYFFPAEKETAPVLSGSGPRNSGRPAVTGNSSRTSGRTHTYIRARLLRGPPISPEHATRTHTCSLLRAPPCLLQRYFATDR